MDIREKLRRATERYRLLAPGDRVLVAVSGGQDSVALATLLGGLSDALRISLVVGHLHHGLRGEAADADQAQVAALAERLGCGFVAERMEVAALARERGTGIEVAGREARYDFFERAALAHGCDKVALGHTATDRAETLLMNLMRGAGLRGMASIPPRRGMFVRPLILATRQETGDFCRSQGVGVCEDRCNSDPAYRRNRGRAGLLPQLEAAYGPGLEAALCRAAEHAWDELEWTEALVAEAFERCRGENGLAAEATRALPRGLRQRVLRAFLESGGCALTDISEERWEALGELVSRGQTGKRVELGGGRSVCLEYGALKLRPPTDPPLWSDELRLTVPGATQLLDGRWVVAEITATAPEVPSSTGDAAVLDAERAGSELVLRLPRPGDRFVPSGMTGHKKLQDYFVDTKAPQPERHPLLVVGHGEVLWVVGHRLAETARPDEHTRQFVTVRVG
jgi:tRNA(Ile)-lysidine synthase